MQSCLVSQSTEFDRKQMIDILQVSGHLDYRRKLRDCLEAVGAPVREARVETCTKLQVRFFYILFLSL